MKTKIDRTGQFEQEPEIIVTLPCGFIVRFWITGLTDKEYIRRAKEIKAFSKLENEAK